MIFAAVHRDHLHVLFDRSDGWHETVAIEAIGVQLVRGQIGRADDDHALLEHHLEQTPEDDRVTDVIDEQLVETQHPHLFTEFAGQRLQRVGSAGQLKRALMHPTHEMVKVLAPRRHPQVLVKLIHQPGFAAPDRAPEIHATDRRAPFVQRLMALLQGPDGMFLGFVLDEALLFDGVLPGAEGRVDIHARQYATRQRPLQ
ncbi:hypothetical protein D3C85_915520 [compost metagenome]